jgi:ammonium transporter, Amt family
MWMRNRKRVLDLMMAGWVGIALAACEHGAIAQDEKKEDAMPPAAATDTAAATLAALGSTAELTRQDPAKPPWPDATGASAGPWTTPSPDTGDGDPKPRTTGDLYDRIVHNLFSVNMVWKMVTGFLVLFMQAALAFVLHFRRLSGQEEEGFQ